MDVCNINVLNINRNVTPTKGERMNIRKFYGRQKIALDRSRMWFGVFQFFFISVLLLKNYDHTIIGHWVFTHQFYSMPLLGLLILVIANVIKYIEKRYQLREAENSETNKYNVEVMQILKHLEEIKDKQDNSG